MKSVQTAAPGAIRVVDIDRPVPGPHDVLVRIRACGICGTDAGHIACGGLPFGPGGALVPAHLGHEPAGEVADVGAANVAGLAVGDRVVVNPMASRGSVGHRGGSRAGGGVSAPAARGIANPARRSMDRASAHRTRHALATAARTAAPAPQTGFLAFPKEQV